MIGGIMKKVGEEKLSRAKWKEKKGRGKRNNKESAQQRLFHYIISWSSNDGGGWSPPISGIKVRPRARRKE